MKISLESNLTRDGLSFYIWYTGHELGVRYSKLLKPLTGEFLHLQEHEALPREPTGFALSEDVVELYNSLGKELRRLGLVEQHPSKELLIEKDARIGQMSTIVDKLIYSHVCHCNYVPKDGEITP